MSERKCRVLIANGEPAAVARMEPTELGPSIVHLDELDRPGSWGPSPMRGDFSNIVAQLSEAPHDATGLEIPSTRWGEFHPRMAWRGTRTHRYPRPGMDGSPYESYFHQYHASQLQAAHVSSLILYERLANALEVLEPHPRNACAYGHELRHLLIAACTEVEAGWRGVLGANGYGGSGHFKTTDYVKLKEPLRLGDWVVRLKAYPEFASISPFGTWSSDRPSKSLPWYEAYNSVKHDREGELYQASLQHVVSAMAAVAVMGWAQFGEQVIGIESVPHTALFLPEQRPQWTAQQLYYGPRLDDHTDWHPVAFSFE